MALDGIVRMVDAFFRHWDDTEKMWSEYERAGFRLVVIGGELHLSELRTGRTDEIPMQASAIGCALARHAVGRIEARRAGGRRRAP
jgi:hypothetical protein